VLSHKANIEHSQSALRDLVFRRDGPKCLLTGIFFIGDGAVIPRCAHLIPFSVGSKVRADVPHKSVSPFLRRQTQTHRAIETVTGNLVTAEIVHQFIKDPRNALNIETNAHDSLDKFLAWGIEANFVDRQWRYFFRVVRRGKVLVFVKARDGEEILFGQGEDDDEIDRPDPNIRNLHLAVARVLAALGIADVFDKYLEDDDVDEWHVPIYFGGPFVSDDVLMRRLEALAR